jgi:hypothetical protein
MGVLIDILKEVPLSAVLKEHLKELEAKMAALETENSRLTTENEALLADLNNAKGEIDNQKNLKERAEACVFCRSYSAEVVNITPDPVQQFAMMGRKVFHYRCSSCGKTFTKQKNS